MVILRGTTTPVVLCGTLGSEGWRLIGKGRIIMQLIYLRYNKYHNSIDITTFNGYLLRIDCNMAERGLKVTPNSQCALNALAIDEPLEYAIHRIPDGFAVSGWRDAGPSGCGG